MISAFIVMKGKTRRVPDVQTILITNKLKMRTVNCASHYIVWAYTKLFECNETIWITNAEERQMKSKVALPINLNFLSLAFGTVYNNTLICVVLMF